MTLLREAMIKKAKESKGFLIDGYPRELEQGKRFEAEVSHVNGVIYFHVSDDTMKKRLLKRAETSGRVDDNEATIVKRLKTFHDLTQPVIDHYDKQQKVFKVGSLMSTSAFEALLDLNDLKKVIYFNPSFNFWVNFELFFWIAGWGRRHCRWNLQESWRFSW